MENKAAFSTRKHRIDKLVKLSLMIPTVISASFVVFIVVFVTKRGVSPFLVSQYGDLRVGILPFLTGTTWFVPPNVYGIMFVTINTLYLVILAALISVPVSVLSALFIARMTNRIFSTFFKTIIELLAAVPSIIYGVFGLGIITKFVISVAEVFNTQTAGGISALSTVLVLAIMIFPTITLLSITAINAVDRDLEKGSLALGASKIQTFFRVTLLSAKSGIFTGIILGIGRALGEATAVSMVAGNSGSGPSFDLFATTRTLTSTMLLGLKETTGIDYDIRFSVGVVLIFVIIASNLLLNHFKNKIGRFSS
ncbi:MAG: phosphate ABC transporter permease subunit PstC [Bacilli bacterium]|nr:phosphate ABC transporter permease subunit PstC [Bacilli bacterium]MBN2696082.1 phosphate ABC transporter permease subunit PstC [Bacilli bacterium]